MTDQRLLRDIGGEPDPPVLYKDRQLGPIPVLSKGEICPGYIGRLISRECYGFVGFRQHEEHFHVKMEAYMLSDRVLRAIRDTSAFRILIAEEDTDRVYEWHHSQWRHDVPQHAKGEDEKDEEQTYAPVSAAWGVYDDHASEVLIGEREVN